MPADLHVHTNCSDGTQSPEEVVGLAAKAGLKSIAITDHDVVAGIDAAMKKGLEVGVEVIPGIEFTTEAQDTEIHILGYFIDHRSPELLEKIARIQQGRKERIFQICEKMHGLGIELKPERVFEIAGHEAAGRPNVARALIEAGHVKDFREAFNRYLEYKGPAYVSHYKLSPEEAVKLVLAANGLPVYAHPAVSKCDQIIPDLILAGLVGIEAYYIGHNQGTTKHYLALAMKLGLLVTGGSDYHGTISGREVSLGDISISDELVDKLRNEHIRRDRSTGS